MNSELLPEANTTSDTSGPSEATCSYQKQLSELSPALSPIRLHIYREFYVSHKFSLAQNSSLMLGGDTRPGRLD